MVLTEPNSRYIRLVDSHAQTYLDYDEFEPVMGMTAPEFYNMPRWKQQKHKTKIGLF